jgi:hypothetical protein
MNFTVRRVETRTDLMKFIKCQWNFYQGDKNFVPPLIADRLKLLDTVKNPFYKHSKMQLFIAENSGDIVGRIGAIINDNHNKTHNDKAGFFGFFECADDQEVAGALFKAAEDWLKDKGMNSVIGPENPSMNDEIGLLIEGFDSPPVILMTYNPEYYMGLIENAGYAKAKDLYAYLLKPETYMSEKLKRLAEVIRDRTGVKFRKINMKDKEEYKKDVTILKEIYNGAWVPNWGFVKWTDEEFDFIAGDLKQIANPDLAIIAEIDGKPVGFGLALPNVNECFIHNKKGGMLGAVWHLLTKKKKIEFTRIIALGILPEYQKTGIDAVMYYEIGSRSTNNGYKYGEASWILEDNEMMNRGLTKTMNADVYKIYRLYGKDI